MKLTLWGTRGSIAAAGADTVRYGGDTSCVEVIGDDSRRLILDAGSGIRRLGQTLEPGERADIFLSHLHMDHVQGLPFFTPLLDAETEVHIWGPVSTTQTLRDRLSRYLSPPLFPVRVRDLPNVHFHDVLPGEFEVGSFGITADLVCHPGSTLGYRLQQREAAIAYIPDHEPALGNREFPHKPRWTSGFRIASGADFLIHDSQYTDSEYPSRTGWGHSSSSHVLAFAEMAEVANLVTFHHDPAHTDTFLDGYHAELESRVSGFTIVPGLADREIFVSQ